MGRGTEQVMAIASPCITPASKGSINELAWQFYEAARTGEGWEEALGNTAAQVGANTAVIIISKKNTNIPTEFLVGGRLSGDAVSLYTERYNGLDPVSEVVRNLPIGLVESCHHYVKRGFVRKSSYYQEFLIPRGGRYSSGARLFEDGREWGRIGFQTNEKQGPIAGQNFRMLQNLTPHIKEAMRQYRFARSMRAEAHRRGMLEAFQQLGCGAALVEGNCAIVQMNQAAERYLGRGVSRLNGRFAPSDRNAWTRFQQLIAMVARMTRFSARECVFPLNRIEGRPLIARISPVFEPETMGRRQALVLIKLIDLDARANVAAACLREVFALTPAEARLAAALASGQTLKDVAAKRGVTDGTVRGQIKSVFAKTETSGQTELVALLERLSIMDRK
jgi:DNA-binding CsgD family transcriptional regulator